MSFGLAVDFVTRIECGLVNDVRVEPTRVTKRFLDHSLLTSESLDVYRSGVEVFAQRSFSHVVGDVLAIPAPLRLRKEGTVHLVEMSVVSGSPLAATDPARWPEPEAFRRLGECSAEVELASVRIGQAMPRGLRRVSDAHVSVIASRKSGSSEIIAPLVFCHGDLGVRNVLWDPRGSKFGLVDFEFAGWRAAGYDVAQLALQIERTLREAPQRAAAAVTALEEGYEAMAGAHGFVGQWRRALAAYYTPREVTR